MAGELSNSPSRIDYRKLSAGLDYYESLGYPYIEVPWVVSREAVAVTLPENAKATSVQYGDLVGSGEQSFIELMLRGQAILKACCITPCFRIEDNYDNLHHPYFMKLELINSDATWENLEQMIADASGFFQKYIEVEVIQTESDTYDIIDTQRKIELGSYGFRTVNNDRFIYGTGLALPRLDTVIPYTT
jgi:hypothetical protein